MRDGGRLLDFGYRRDLAQRVELGEVIGAGAYGVVRAATDVATGAPCACKSIPKHRPRLEPALLAGYAAKIRSEVDTHFALGHSLNIVFPFDAYEDDSAVHLVMERCTGGSLWQRADLVAGGFSEARAAGVMRAVLRTVAQCHARGVVFRDIKPDNYLLASRDPDAALKLSDFGLAARCRPGEVLTERCGTLGYMAPEVVGQRYSQRADLWSAGVLLYQLLSGRLPFVDEEAGERGPNAPPNTKNVFRSILFAKLDLESQPWDAVSPAAKDLVAKLLERDPTRRVDAATALEHGWVREAGLLARQAPLQGTVVARLQRFGTAGALQQAALRAVARAAAATPQQADRGNDAADVAALFDAIDTDRRGAVWRADVEAALAAGGYALSHNEWARLLDEMDATRSGSVSRADFVAALLDWRRVAATEPRWAEWAETAYHEFGGTESDGVDAAALLDAVCHVDWDALQPGAVCRDAVADALGEVQAPDGRISLAAWRALLASAGSDEALGEFDARVATAP